MMEQLALGKHWAAIKDNRVIAVLSMSVPADIDFPEYRKRAFACLELLGKVKGGEVIERDGERYFLLPHPNENRSKQPKPPKEFWLFKPGIKNQK